MAVTQFTPYSHKAIAIAISGIAGIIAQVILLRELLVSFQGNELSLGIILANWLLFEAIGSYIAGKTEHRFKNKLALFALTQLLVTVGLPLGIFIARSARLIMGLPVGQGLGVDAMFVVSVLALLPASVLHGAAFTFATMTMGTRNDSHGKTYVFENLGTMIGGVLVTFALIPIFNSFEIALIAMFLSAIAAVSVLWHELKHQFKFRPAGYFYIAVPILLPLIFAFFIENLQKQSLSVQWAGQNLVSHKNTIYGNIAVIEQGGEYTFFTDGQPVITSPFPDIVRLEEFVHFAMLSHQKPQSIAILTGGVGGKIYEILKHPYVKTIDYVELDPELPAKVKEFPTPLTTSELTHHKVRLHLDDGRYFLKKSKNFYDVCIVGISNPTDLQTNRFFTLEFFKTVNNRLNPGGVLALSLPSLPRVQIQAEGLAAMNRSVYATLHKVFSYVRVFPGEGSNIFIASNSQYIMNTNALSMSSKIESKGLEVALLSLPYIEYRTLPWWSENFYASIENWETSAINKDFDPRVVFESMLYFSEMFTPGVAAILNTARNYGAYALIAGLLVAVAMVTFLRKRGDVPFSIFTTGFAGMMLDLVIIFAFQAIFGYVFYWIGVLVSVFMAGAALAALIITRKLPTMINPVKTYLKTDVAVLSLCFLMPLVLIVLHHYTFDGLPVVLSKSIFVIMSFSCGLLVGAQYPLACHILETQGKGRGSTAGLLYGLDLFGGWFGGVLGGLLLLPLLGLFNACLVLAGVKFCSVALIFFARRKNG